MFERSQLEANDNFAYFEDEHGGRYGSDRT